jgi:hypothetical protein
MSAPPTSFPDAGQHGANHTDDGKEAYYGIEPSEDDVRDDNPIERPTWNIEMSVESFLWHNVYLNFICKDTHNSPFFRKFAGIFNK